jgi:hypothetical protein
MKMDPLTTVSIIKVKYIYFLYSNGVKLNISDRKIVRTSHATTAMNNPIG